MSNLQEILSRWFDDIAKEVKAKGKNIQLHKKISKDSQTKSGKAQKRSDVTISYSQSVYGSQNVESTIGGVIGSKSTSIRDYCLSSTLTVDSMVNQQVEAWFKEPADHNHRYSNMVSDFKASMWTQVTFYAFLERLRTRADYQSFCLVYMPMPSQEPNEDRDDLISMAVHVINHAGLVALRELFQVAEQKEPPSAMTMIERFLASERDTPKAVKERIELFTAVITAGDEVLRDFLNRYTMRALLEQEHLVFLWSVLLPPSVRQSMDSGKIKVADEWNMVALIRDVELSETLQQLRVPSSDVNRFLVNRRVSFGPLLTDTTLLELRKQFPLINLENQRGSDLCMLVMLNNMRKTLRLGRPTKPATDLRTIKIPVGINRENLPDTYNILTRPEKAKAAMRRAKTMYTSGLSKILLGLQKNRPDQTAAGFSSIFNLHNAQAGKLKTVLTKTCGFYNYKNDKKVGGIRCDALSDSQCAATALLLAYMETMDCMVDPEPPLMARRDMCVTELYVNPTTLAVETFREVEHFTTWTQHKQRKFRQAHAVFIRRYQSVGFSEMGKHPVTELPVLNLDDWGEGDIVANPFRVREDTMLNKLCGSLRFEFNRLGIGNEARRVWAQHKIRVGFDRRYCNKFIKHCESMEQAEYFPRPIFDMNFYDPENLDSTADHSLLYFNASTSDANGPRAAMARRELFDKMSAVKWFNLPFGSILETTKAGELYPKIGKKTASGSQTTSLDPRASSLMNIHQNFRRGELTATSNSNSEAIVLGVDVSPQWYLFGPVTDNKLGITPNAAAWKHLTSKKEPFNKTMVYQTPFGPISRMNCEPAPPLFGRLYHPLEHKFVDFRKLWHHKTVCTNPTSTNCNKYPAWVNLEVPQDRYFPYPVTSMAGEVSVEILPGSQKTKVNNEWVFPYKPGPVELHVIVPDQTKGFWDLRNSLIRMFFPEEMDRYKKINGLLPTGLERCIYSSVGTEQVTLVRHPPHTTPPNPPADKMFSNEETPAWLKARHLFYTPTPVVVVRSQLPELVIR